MKYNSFLLILSFVTCFGSCSDCSEAAGQDTVVVDVPLFDTEKCEDVVDVNSCHTGEMLDFIYGELNYPEEAKQAEVAGTVSVRFEILIDGTTTDQIVVDGIGFGCDDEALRLVELLHFIPARNGSGEDIISTMSLLIRFQL